MKTKSLVPIVITTTVAVLIISLVFYNSVEQNELTIEKTSPIKLIEIEKAEKFNVVYDGTDKILTDGAGRTLILTHNEVNSENQIKIPVHNVVIFSSTHAAFIDRLGISDRVVGVAWGGNYEWHIKNIRDGLQSGKIKDVGLGSNPSYDEIVSLKPDLVVLVGGEGLWEKQAKKFDELGIPYVVNSEYLENDALGRFEWIKFFSLFVDKEDESEKIYAEVKTKSDQIFASVSESKTPTVLWTGVFKGSAYVPKGNSYVGTTLENANSKYVFADLEGIGSSQISLEELIFKGTDSDILIYSSSSVNSIKDIVETNPILSSLKSIQNCQVYAFEPWYWQKIDRFEDFVNDVAFILHPQVFEDYELKQFKKVSCD